MDKKYIRIFKNKDEFDFIKSYKTQDYIVSRRNESEYNTYTDTLYINVTERPDDYIREYHYNECFLFYYTNKWFPQLFTNSTKYHISKITKNVTNKFVNNLYNKVKCNIIDYMTGNVITDLIDTIIYSITTYSEKNSELSFVDTIIESISDRIYNELFNNKINCVILDTEQKEKIERTEIKISDKNDGLNVDIPDKKYEPTKTESLIEAIDVLEKEYNIFIEDTEKYFVDTLYEYIKNLVKYKVLHYIGVEILRTFKKSKEFDYINNDSKSYFNTSASAFEDQVGDLNEIMSMSDVTKPGIINNASKFISESLELIKDYIMKNDKFDYKEFESIVATSFDNHFEQISNIINFYDKLNSSINSYKKDSIAISECIHNTFRNTKLFSIKYIVDIVKGCEELSRQYSSSKDSIYFIDAIKKSFKCSALRSIRRKLDYNTFDVNIFKRGLVKDFNQSKSFVRYLNRLIAGESKNRNLVDQFVNRVYDKIRLLTSSTVDPITRVMWIITTIEQLYSDINTLVYRYRNTNAYDIARLYIANDKIDDIVLSKGFDFDKSEKINKKYRDKDNYFNDNCISPHIKLNTSYRSFIK